MRKKLVLAYPNLRWKKFDIQTVWNLNPAILCLLGRMVENDVDVKIVDAQFYDMSMEDFIAEIEDFGADYVGISMLTSEYQEILHLAAKEIKALNSDIVVIAGGVHVTIEYAKVMEDPNIDFAVRGEGEYVLPALLRHLQGANEFPSEGLVYRENGRLIAQPQAWVKQMSDLPMPNYDLVKMEDYVSVGARYGPLRPPEFPHVRMIVTRGCPVGCSFCQVESISGKKVRSPTPEQVADELLYLKERYGIKSVVFDDDNMVIKKKFFKAMLRQFIKKKLGLKFIIGAFAIFALDDEMLDLMAEAGCVGINVAIESGNQRVMDDVVMKPLKLTTVPDQIAKVRAKGLFVIANFIIGFPGESWEEIRETVRFAETCGADYVKLFIAVPLKGTKMWDMAMQMGAFDGAEDDIRVDWRFSQIKANDWTPKDISILRAYEWDRINFGTPERRARVSNIWGMSEEELAEIRKQTRDAVTLGFENSNMVVN